MSLTDLVKDQVDHEVERLFKENPPIRGKLCRNPVTGGSYVGVLDSTKLQKEQARRPLLAREWFRSHGPADAQPFPVSYNEREDLKGTGLLSHILAWYARSLEGRHYNFDEHPSFADYVAGVLWEGQLAVGSFAGIPNYPASEMEELKRRYPPKMLKGMGPGLYWAPPDEHREIMARLRRDPQSPETYFDRA